MSTLPPVTCFTSSGGLHIYRIPMVVFPNGFIAYSYLILGTSNPMLIDVGSGFGASTTQLFAGLETVHDDFSEAFTMDDIGTILVTHGHLDHFGGIAEVNARIKAKIGVHPLDRRILTHYEERIIMATKDLDIYLERAGVEESNREFIIDMYGFTKQHIKSVPVDFSLDETWNEDGFTVYHTPGHCSGQVCLMVDDVLLCADHILSHTTPHLSPESITRYTGLGHYQESLDKISRIEGIKLALGGHEDPMEDVYSRITEIHASHQRKLDRVLNYFHAAGQPSTIEEITRQMYPNVTHYDILLAIESVGAHVEYLYQRGMLAVANLDEVAREHNPAMRYSPI